MCVYVTDLLFFVQVRGHAVRDITPGDDAAGVSLFQLIKHFKTRILLFYLEFTNDIAVTIETSLSNTGTMLGSLRVLCFVHHG